jgi:pimeloyl-ACP methyl ester carboxylesterase
LAAAPIALGILVYAGASFVLMRRFVDRRPLGRLLRELCREIAWAALTQPLLPLFYFVGRRLAAGATTPVVLVHGYTQNRVDFLRIARALARAGRGPVYGFNYPWFGAIHANAARLARFIEGVQRETGASRVDLVAHSLGGLVALEYLHVAGTDSVRRLVTIASPHAGVAWRGPILGACGPQIRAGCAFLEERAVRRLPVPCLSVYSTHDNIVHPPSTAALVHRGARDHVVGHVAHLSILFEPEVACAIVDFLSAPDEASTAPPPPDVETAQADRLRSQRSSWSGRSAGGPALPGVSST